MADRVAVWHGRCGGFRRQKTGGSDEPCRNYREDTVGQAAEGAELENDLRRDRWRLDDLSDGGAPWPDEVARRAGRARREDFRARRGGDLAAAGSAVSRLVADAAAERSADLPLLRTGQCLRHD